MINQKIKILKYFSYTLFAMFFIILFGCSSTPKFDKDGNPVYSYEIEENLDFRDVEEPYKYIFIRLYDVNYLNPFYVANILKFGIEWTEVSDITASHVAINFSLNDDFYGLTSGGEYQLAKESCMDTKSNKFMKRCNPETSEQITYAIKVSEDEYNAAKKYVEECAASKDIKYDVSENFKMASFVTKRKFFTKKENKEFGTVKYPESKNPEDEDPDYLETNFVCSTFIAYTLMKNVDYIKEWFAENEINYEYVVVTDIPAIPGMVRLFSSKFYEYDVAVEAFVEKYPEFKDYLWTDIGLSIEFIPDSEPASEIELEEKDEESAS